MAITLMICKLVGGGEMSLIFRIFIILKKEKGTNKYSNLGITLVSEGSKDDCDLKTCNKYQYNSQEI